MMINHFGSIIIVELQFMLKMFVYCLTVTGGENLDCVKSIRFGSPNKLKRATGWYLKYAMQNAKNNSSALELIRYKSHLEATVTGWLLVGMLFGPGGL